MIYLIQVALTVLEAHLKVSREMRQGSLLTEGVKQVTSVMYAPSVEQVKSPVIFRNILLYQSNLYGESYVFTI